MEDAQVVLEQQSQAAALEAAAVHQSWSHRRPPKLELLLEAEDSGASKQQLASLG